MQVFLVQQESWYKKIHGKICKAGCQWQQETRKPHYISSVVRVITEKIYKKEPYSYPEQDMKGDIPYMFKPGVQILFCFKPAVVQQYYVKYKYRQKYIDELQVLG